MSFLLSCMNGVRARFLLGILAVALCVLFGYPAGAIEAVRTPLNAAAIDLTPAIERYKADGDLIPISTAAGADGIVRRIAVKARESGTRPEWIVFALTNDTTEQLDRLVVTPYHRLVGSGVIWPDLGAQRITAITASQGEAPNVKTAPMQMYSRSRSILAQPSPTWRN
jgi:hypothetical protein